MRKGRCDFYAKPGVVHEIYCREGPSSYIYCGVYLYIYLEKKSPLFTL